MKNIAVLFLVCALALVAGATTIHVGQTNADHTGGGIVAYNWDSVTKSYTPAGSKWDRNATALAMDASGHIYMATGLGQGGDMVALTYGGGAYTQVGEAWGGRDYTSVSVDSVSGLIHGGTNNGANPGGELIAHSPANGLTQLTDPFHRPWSGRTITGVAARNNAVVLCTGNGSAGGYGQGDVVPSTFDSVTNTYTMNIFGDAWIGRDCQAITFDTISNRIYVADAGDQSTGSGGELAALQYNPITNSVSELTTPFTRPWNGRGFYSIAVDQNGIIYAGTRGVSGTFNGELDAFLFNPVTNVFTPIGTAWVGRNITAITVDAEGTIHVGTGDGVGGEMQAFSFNQQTGFTYLGGIWNGNDITSMTTAIPEPMTLSLLALGSLGLWRRRRT